MKIVAAAGLLCLAVCAADAAPVTDFEVRLVVQCERGMTVFQVPPPAAGSPAQQVCVAPDVILGQADVVTVTNATKKNENFGVLAITLGPAGRMRLAQATKAALGHPMAIMAHGEVLSAPVIQTPILGGAFNVMGDRGDIDRLFRDLTNGPTQL